MLGVLPYRLSSSLGAVGVEHFNDDNMDDEVVDCPSSAAESPSGSSCALTGLLEWYTEITMT